MGAPSRTGSPGITETNYIHEDHKLKLVEDIQDEAVYHKMVVHTSHSSLSDLGEEESKF